MSPPVDFKPCPICKTRRLWSLWEMLEKYALLFAEAYGLTTETKWLCGSAALEGHVLPDNLRVVASMAMQKLKRACIMSDMDGALPSIDRLSQSMFPASGLTPMPPHGIAQEIKILAARIRDDLESEYFFHVDQRDVSLYGQKELFGTKVSKKFAKAISDIESAGNCLALQQPTAAVFHLMRVMERGVQRFGTKLKVKIDPQVESWAKIIDHVNKEINALPGKTESEKRKRARYATAATYLGHVRLAWRNEVMHPKETYTREEAHDVFNASKAFMTYLAELV